MSMSLTFSCDACGKAAPGVSPSIYSPPPVGWIWASQQGPHACGEKCWWHVDTAHKGRTGQALEAISHDSVVEEGESEEIEEAPPPPPPAAIVKAPQRAAVPAKARARVEEAEVVEEPRRKVVPLSSNGACTECGGELPPRGPGRFPRTKCFECQPPKRQRAS